MTPSFFLSIHHFLASWRFKKRTPAQHEFLKGARGKFGKSLLDNSLISKDTLFRERQAIMNKKLIVRIVVGLVVLASVVFIVRGSLESAPTLDLKPAGPQIVARTPLEGQWLDLSSPIELTFDRDMDQAKTEDAFTLLSPDLEHVSGKISWANARTLVFTPSALWKPASVYQAVFSTEAAGLDGSTLTEEIRIEFTTIDALAVSQIFPADSTLGVDVNASITVIFNRPIVPLSILEEQDRLPQPVEITPAVEGKGEWVNSSVYLFEPEGNFKSSTNYQVRVEAGLEDVVGNRLEETFTAQFTTRAPAVNHVALKDGSWIGQDFSGVLLDQAFVVVFDEQEMDKESVESAIQIVNRETQKAFPIEFEWNEAVTAVVVSPKDLFEIDSHYQFIVDDSAKASDGGSLAAPWSVNFSTVPYPAVIGIYPEPGRELDGYTSYITLTFASPMDKDTIESRVKVTPSLGGEPQWYYSFYPGSYTVTLYGFEPSTDYVVRILPGMKDIYGNETREEISFEFTNKAYQPSGWLAMPWLPLTYRADGIQDLYFQHRNLEGAKVLVYRLTFEEFARIVADDMDTSKFKPKGQPVREWELNVRGEENAFETEYISLEDETGNPLEPGYYLVGTQIEQFDYNTLFYQANLFLIATDNITLKSTATEGLIWLTDFSGGEPQANVPILFYDEDFNQVGKGRTGNDGVFHLGGLDAIPSYAVAEGEGHFAFTAINWGSGARVGDYGIFGGYYAEPEELFAYIYTDRALYRPGQEVYFKGILRKDDDLHYSLPQLEEVYVVAQYNGENIYEKHLPVSELGNFTDLLQLSDGAEVGTYFISVYENENTDETFISSISFRVAEYEKPEFEVTAAADRDDVLVGDSVNFALDAVYYSGGRVSNGTGDWFIETTNFYFTPSKEYSGFSFMDWDRDVYYSFETDGSRDVVDEGEVVLDENGHAEVEQKFDLKDVKISQRAAFRVNVTDVTGNLVSGSASVVLHASEYYAGIRSASYVGAQGEPQTFDVVVLDWDSTPAAGQPVTVKFVKREWFNVQEQDAHGNLQWKSTVKETPAGQQDAVTDEKGFASVSFTPSAGGVYKAVVATRDSKGNTHQSSTYIWVSSPGFVSWRQTNDRSFRVVPDKDLYSPGETAKLLIAQPFEDEVYALVTYERGHVYKEEVILLDGSSTVYELPITDDMAPIAYVSVVVVSGAERNEIPKYKIGMTSLNIGTEQKELQVTVTADKEVAGPGDEITFNITTLDYKGDPVSADVSLAVIDKAVMALAPPNSPPMLASFYPKRGLGVVTSIGLVTSADAFNEEFREAAAVGESSGGGGGDGSGVITVRENFKDTAIFKAQVVTDKDGKAQVTFTLPENLTTWHADVRAVTEESRVGEGSTEIQTNKPLYVQIQTPRFFVPGDQVQIGAAVHNNTDDDLTVNVTLDAKGVDLESETLRRVEVPANQQKFVSWDVVVQGDAPRVDLTVTAVSGGLTDASKPALGTLPGQGIPVITFTVTESVGTSGVISERGSITEAIQLPDSHTFTDASLTVEIAPSLAASIQPGLTYLRDYPYLCMEQTVSRFLPNVMTMRLLGEAGVSSDLQEDLEKEVNTALQRIYAEQHYDGGWSWWSAAESDPLTSAYVVYGLLEAKNAGYPVSEAVLENGVNFLRDSLPYLSRNDPQWMFNRNAFIVYVLAAADKISAGSSQLSYLFVNRNRLSLFGEAYLAQAIHLLDPEDSRLDTLMSDLESAAVLSASGAHWEEAERDNYNWNSDTRTTAIVLNAFVQINPESPVTVNAVRWLMLNRDRKSVV